MKAGDLVWYNTGGSQEMALVIDVVSAPQPIYMLAPDKMQRFAFVHWCGDGGGLRPKTYSLPSVSSDGSRKDAGWVFARKSMWKVV